MEYILVRTKKRKKSIEFKVIDGQIIVYSPINFSKFEIDKYYTKYKDRLLKKVENTKGKNDKFLYYLGNKLNILQLENLLLKKVIIEIKDDIFYIYKPKNKIIDSKELIKGWQISQAKKIIPERINFFVNKYNFNFSFEKNLIKYKNQKTRWGSCSSKNNLNFNYKIIEKSIDVIDYLVVHELTHTLIKNHSLYFWNYLKNILPDYIRLKKLLNEEYY